MPLALSWTGGAVRQRQVQAPHGLWHVTAPRADGRVELCYGRFDGDGRLPGLPLPIGEFAATAEAMLAVQMYEAALAKPGSSQGPVLQEPWRLLGREGDFVIEPDEVALLLLFEASGDSMRQEVARLVRPSQAPDSSFVLAERPPGLEDPASLDAAILRQLATLRSRRPDVSPLEPLGAADLTGGDAPARHRILG